MVLVHSTLIGWCEGTEVELQVFNILNLLVLANVGAMYSSGIKRKLKKQSYESQIV